MLSDLQRKKLTHYFHILDSNGNGVLEKADFTNIGENLCVLWGLAEGTPEYDTCMQGFIETWNDFRVFIGRDGDSAATLEEWLEFADKTIVNGPPEFYGKYMQRTVKQIIKHFDSNHDGYISLDEYVDLFMAYRIEMKYSAKAFTRLDRNDDGQISVEELARAVKEFFKSDDEKAYGNWLFGFWE